MEVFNKAVDGLGSLVDWIAGLRLWQLDSGVKRRGGNQYLFRGRVRSMSCGPQGRGGSKTTGDPAESLEE